MSIRTTAASVLLGLVAATFAGCGKPAGPVSAAGFAPLDAEAALLWDRQTTESGQLLRTIGDEFNQQWKGLPIKIERAGSYGEIFRKTTASIAGSSVHWLMLLDTMFINAIGAFSTVRAQ